ncbi:hypothetical protein AN639_06485 [Candidatus Epulonipiscium fishelsonii]|uniref:Uncharacterized protein n=1 Tax=Candidatus Epulonipiscium fishelsonii TaxID=77094 RepID=A0ACC8XG50_9FIRM|nr:hypothetical protein AN639_06485 [Epulopiscium sp. SCG-B05WGA-EpuloA1]ONI42247.1 hypothetical protein AN396_01995 [Epulopiscium sp. SCG-B11WGA-EpuloA1]
MCTAITLHTKDGNSLFGRTMDIEYNFGQSVVLSPSNFDFKDRIIGKQIKTKFAVIGMASVVEGYPLFAEGFNEEGLACVSLNFPQFCCYEEKTYKTKINIAPYNLAFYLLGQFKTLKEIEQSITNINLVAEPFLPNLPVPPLHWILTDKTGRSITIEKTKRGLEIHENPVGVLSNSPDFEWHMNNLRQYVCLTSENPSPALWGDFRINPYALGKGLQGMPGDFSSASRFIRATYFKLHSIPESLKQGVIEFFHILRTVSMINGAVLTDKGKNAITQYTSCMALEEGKYFYHTYNNPQIRTIDFKSDIKNVSKLKIYPYEDILNAI